MSSLRSRIIAGIFGGRFINTPNNDTTHPMSERARSAIFNSLSSRLSGAKILDLFAGSGALGLEAISRQAKYAVFVDKSKLACQVIEQNIKTLGLSDKAEVHNMSVASWLAKSPGSLFDIIFIDPPYSDIQADSWSGIGSYLKTDGVLVISLPAKSDNFEIAGLKPLRQQNYGDAKILFFGKA